MLSTQGRFEYILKKIKMSHLFTFGCQNRFKLMKKHPKIQNQCKMDQKIISTTHRWHGSEKYGRPNSKLEILNLYTFYSQSRFKLMKKHPKIQNQCKIEPKNIFTPPSGGMAKTQNLRFPIYLLPCHRRGVKIILGSILH